MKDKFYNSTHIEGYLYDHKLVEKVTGEKSKNPGTPFVQGSIDIATDDAMTNIVTVNYRYVAPTYPSSNAPNGNFPILQGIAQGKYGTVVSGSPIKLRVDSALGLNEFYSDRSGTEELVSVQINDGGFIHIVNELDKDEAKRSTFDCDMIISKVKEVEADPDKGVDNCVTVSGLIFNFRKEVLPYEFRTVLPGAMKYFLGLGATANTPVFTRVRGQQVSNTIKKEFVEESAFGEAEVREVERTRKVKNITWSAKEPYLWDDESTYTFNDLKTALNNREIYLAEQKQNRENYMKEKANASNAFSTAVPGAKSTSNAGTGYQF